MAAADCRNSYATRVYNLSRSSEQTLKQLQNILFLMSPIRHKHISLPSTIANLKSLLLVNPRPLMAWFFFFPFVLDDVCLGRRLSCTHLKKKDSICMFIAFRWSAGLILTLHYFCVSFLLYIFILILKWIIYPLHYRYPFISWCICDVGQRVQTVSIIALFFHKHQANRLVWLIMLTLNNICLWDVEKLWKVKTTRTLIDA